MEQSADQGVGARVKGFREERGWSMAKLAVEADMSVSGVSMIENGKRNLTTTTLAKLARAFGIEVGDLFPKLEAPLWSHDTSEQGAFSFREAREGLEEYCDYCESLLEENGPTDRLIAEVYTTAAGWIPVLDVAQSAELDTLRRSTGLKGSQLHAQSELVQVGKRYLSLFNEIARRHAAERGDRDAKTDLTNVIDLQEAVNRRASKMQRRAVG